MAALSKKNTNVSKAQRIDIILCAFLSVRYVTYKLICALQYVNYIL